VDVVRRILTQLPVEEGGNSGFIMWRTDEQRRCMQWWVERRTSAVVNGGRWRMDCCSSSEWCRSSGFPFSLAASRAAA
jgi:hypothetical protein